MGYTLFVKLHNSWPAIHRVLLAARGLALDDWDMPMPACTKELVEALRAVYAIAGEDYHVGQIIEAALADYE